MDKTKKKKFICLGAGIISAGIIATAGFYDNHINHLNVYCPLSRILGVSHQIYKANEECKQPGFVAYTSDDGLLELQFELTAEEQEDGTIKYILPEEYEGYRIWHNRAYKIFRYKKAKEEKEEDITAANKKI